MLSKLIKSISIDSRIKPRTTIVNLDKKFSITDIGVVGSDKFYDNRKIFLSPSGRRGFTYIFVNGKLVATLSGLPKFFGDHNMPNCVKEIATELGTYKKSLFLNKANGECCHLSAFEYDGQKYIISGSKNVHMIARIGSKDINNSAYEGQRYTHAKKFTKLILHSLRYSGHQDEIIDYLIKNKCTFVGECILPDQQHIVDYNGLRCVQWFAISSPKSITDNGYTCILPDEGLQLFKSFGLFVVPWIIEADKHDKGTLQKIFNEHNCEGAVRYDIHETKNKKFVIGLVEKIKSRKYVYLRALREKMNSLSSLKTLQNRFDRLVDQNITVTPEELQECINFYAYCVHIIPKNEWKDFSSKWCTLRNKFKIAFEKNPNIFPKYIQELKERLLEKEIKKAGFTNIALTFGDVDETLEKKLIKKFSENPRYTTNSGPEVAVVHISENKNTCLKNEFLCLIKKKANVGEVIAYIFSGQLGFKLRRIQGKKEKKQKQIAATGPVVAVCSPVPGCGKSTVAAVLAIVLKGEHINQDALGGKAKLFHKTIRNTNGLVIIDKCLHNNQTRTSLSQAIGDRPIKWIQLGVFNDDLSVDLDATINIAEERIESRGNAHKSLFPENASRILRSFKASYEPFGLEKVLSISMEDTLFDQVDTIVNYLGHHKIKKEKINKAIAIVLQTEKDWKSKNQITNLENKNIEKIPVSIQLSIHALEYEDITELEAVQEHLKNLPEDFKVKDALHLTLVYLNKQDNRKINWRDLLKLNGEEIGIKLYKIARNKNISAIACSITTPNIVCQNNIPHLTLAQRLTDNGQLYPAKRSNKMLESTNFVDSVDLDLEIEGILTIKW